MSISLDLNIILMKKILYNSVTIVRPTEKYIALSNMPVEKEITNSPSLGLTEVKVS